MDETVVSLYISTAVEVYYNLPLIVIFSQYIQIFYPENWVKYRFPIFTEKRTFFLKCCL